MASIGTKHPPICTHSIAWGSQELHNRIIIIIIIILPLFIVYCTKAKRVVGFLGYRIIPWIMHVCFQAILIRGSTWSFQNVLSLSYLQCLCVQCTFNVFVEEKRSIFGLATTFPHKMVFHMSMCILRSVNKHYVYMYGLHNAFCIVTPTLYQTSNQMVI